MPFVLPTFNILADIYRQGGTGGTYGVPDVHTPANLSPGKRIMLGAFGPAAPFTLVTIGGGHVMELLLPPLTDIRATWNSVAADLVEVPAGSKRFYHVAWVDDIGKGFANEHRMGILGYFLQGNTTLTGGPFPAPVPLP